MMEQVESILYKMRFIIAGICVIASLLLVSLLLSPKPAQASGQTQQAQVPAARSIADTSALSSYDGPNAITGGMSTAASEFGQTVGSAGHAVNAYFANLGAVAARSSKQSASFVFHGVHSGVAFAAHGTVHSIGFAARGVASSVGFVFHVPSHVFGYVSNTAVVSAVIKPADNTQLPTIDPRSPALLASSPITPIKTVSATVEQPVAVPTAQVVDNEPAWPIHGAITTYFGVPHWPYQPTHTGLDISDGLRSGVTPIKPFKPGKVIEVVQSNVSFGNHVIVDHGGGVTSLYGHMYSISVQVGQEVDKTTTLGYEGSTGASTGTHLHFEIRVDGQPSNPQRFISGNP